MMLFGRNPSWKPQRPPSGKPYGRPKRDLTGETMGQLKALLDTGRRRNGQRLWLCQCLACGRYVEVRQNFLVSDRRRTCGCGQRVPRARKEWWELG